MKAQIYGKSSEIIASNYLKEKGYKIIATNYKNKVGEIDVIALDKDILVFVEVKSRETRRFGDPLEAIDEQKMFKLKCVASAYLKKLHRLDAKCRFDAIAILGKEELEIRHIVDIFN